jgi:hypothetical protein
MPLAAPLAMPRPRSARPLVLLLVLAASLAAAAPAGADVYAGDPVVGPTPALQSLGGIDLAPDGTGAMVYTLQDGGVDHAFASRLVNGAWSAPERLDGTLAGPSSQPVVAAADGGRVAVAFVNAGNVYVAMRVSSGTAWTLQGIWGAGGASDPSVDLSVNGKGYLAFTAPGAGGHDVRVAYSRDARPWSLLGPPLDANVADDAGAGTARPRIAVSADGTAIAVWGENGHVIARRVRGTSPSVVFVDATADLAIEGVGAVSADLPVVSAQDDDSFTAVAFRATFTINGAPRSRAVYRRLRGSRFEAPTALDVLPFASGQSSTDPELTTVGAGQGIALGSGDASFLSYAMVLKGDSGPAPVVQVDSLATSTAPTFAAPAAATPLKMLVAWQLTPASGDAEIHGRYWDGTAFEPEEVLSKAQYGPTLAADGLADAGDDNGDLAVAYVQDVPGQGPAIAVATVDQPPGRFAAIRDTAFQRTARPVLSWTPSRESWGGYFRVSVDGVQVALTGRRSFRVRTPLTQGVHTWQVTALDRRGQQYVAPASLVRIDSVPATVLARLSGARRSGARLRLAVRASDAPPLVAGAPPIATSGVKLVLVDWGDHTPRQLIRGGLQHVYARPGRYVLKVLAVDRAGNRTTVVQRLRIVKPPKKKKAKKHAARHGG